MFLQQIKIGKRLLWIGVFPHCYCGLVLVFHPLWPFKNKTKLISEDHILSASYCISEILGGSVFINIRAHHDGKVCVGWCDRTWIVVICFSESEHIKDLCKIVWALDISHWYQEVVEMCFWRKVLHIKTKQLWTTDLLPLLFLLIPQISENHEHNSNTQKTFL